MGNAFAKSSCAASRRTTHAKRPKQGSRIGRTGTLLKGLKGLVLWKKTCVDFYLILRYDLIFNQIYITWCFYILFITFYHHLWRFSMYTIPLSLIRSEQKQSKSAKPKLQKFRKNTSKSLTIPFEMPGCGRPASSWYPKNKASQSLGKVAMVLATTSSALGSIARTSSSRIMPHFALARWGWLEQGGVRPTVDPIVAIGSL